MADVVGSERVRHGHVSQYHSAREHNLHIWTLIVVRVEALHGAESEQGAGDDEGTGCEGGVDGADVDAVVEWFVSA